MTIGIAWMGYEGIVVDDNAVGGAWFALPLLGLYLWFDYMLAAKIISPPELEISPAGIRWSNPAMLQWNTNYGWDEIDGPEKGSGGYGIPLLQFVVKASGRKLALPPSHFGATYDEMAALISAAREGSIISPERWLSDHPQHMFRHWLLDWGLPIAGGLLVGIGLIWFNL